MSSTSVSSAEPTPRPAALIPQLDLTALAKTTRKTLERLVPFSHMRSSTSEISPRLTKIMDKINRYTTLIDSSILCQQLGYQLANNCMVLCDPELSVGLSTRAPGGRKKPGVATTHGRGGAWTPVGVGGQLGPGVFGREDAYELAGRGYEIALKVKEGFSGIAQEMYKIAASTKDDMSLVLVPPDPTHSETLKIYLKDVGANLVANLSLLSEFSNAASKVADWWSLVKDGLALEEASSLLLPFNNDTESEMFAWWSEMKDNFQEYYDVINVVHLRFPELLPSSSLAWQSVASVHSEAPNSTGQSESDTNPRKLLQSKLVVLGTLGSFRLGWKWVDKGKKGEEKKKKKKPKKGLVLKKENAEDNTKMESSQSSSASDRSRSSNLFRRPGCMKKDDDIH